jgi:hypothetical protein
MKVLEIDHQFGETKSRFIRMDDWMTQLYFILLKLEMFLSASRLVSAWFVDGQLLFNLWLLVNKLYSIFTGNMDLENSNIIQLSFTLEPDVWNWFDWQTVNARFSQISFSSKLIRRIRREMIWREWHAVLVKIERRIPASGRNEIEIAFENGILNLFSYAGWQNYFC